MSTRRLQQRPSLESLVQRVDAQRPGEVTGDTVPTGFASLDKILGGGLRRRDLVVLAATSAPGNRRWRWAWRCAWRNRAWAWRFCPARWTRSG